MPAGAIVDYANTLKVLDYGIVSLQAVVGLANSVSLFDDERIRRYMRSVSEGLSDKSG